MSGCGVREVEGGRTEAANGAPNGIPHCQQQTDSRERLFASGKRARIFVARALRFILCRIHVVRLDLEIERVVDVVEYDLAKVATVREVELEDDLAAEGNVSPEVDPLAHTDFKRLLERLS